MAGAANPGWVSGWNSIDEEGTNADTKPPITSVIHTPDFEVVAITISQGWAGSSLNPFLNVLGLVRENVWASVPQDRVAIKTTGIVGGVRPGDINRVVTGPHTRGMAGAANPGWVSRWGSIDVEWAESSHHYPRRNR
ncbi:hypothetical protein ES703_67219 [subsurface metagenome]